MARDSAFFAIRYDLIGALVTGRRIRTLAAAMRKCVANEKGRRSRTPRHAARSYGPVPSAQITHWPKIRESHLAAKRREPPNPYLRIMKKWDDLETFAPNPKSAGIAPKRPPSTPSPAFPRSPRLGLGHSRPRSSGGICTQPLPVRPAIAGSGRGSHATS